MSKSDPSDMTRINLTDDADTIAQKIRKARTDPEPLPTTSRASEARAEADNLVNIYAALAGTSAEAVVREYAGSLLGLQARARRSRRRPPRPDQRRDAAADGRPRRDRPHPRRRRRHGARHRRADPRPDLRHRRLHQELKQLAAAPHDKAAEVMAPCCPHGNQEAN